MPRPIAETQPPLGAPSRRRLACAARARPHDPRAAFAHLHRPGAGRSASSSRTGRVARRAGSRGPPVSACETDSRRRTLLRHQERLRTAPLSEQGDREYMLLFLDCQWCFLPRAIIDPLVRGGGNPAPLEPGSMAAIVEIARLRSPGWRVVLLFAESEAGRCGLLGAGSPPARGRAGESVLRMSEVKHAEKRFNVRSTKLKTPRVRRPAETASAVPPWRAPSASTA